MPYVLENCFLIHTWFILRGIYAEQYAWHPGIIYTYDTTYGIHYQVFMCDRRIPGSWYDKPCLRELSNQVLAGTLLHVQFWRQTVKIPAWTVPNRDPVARFHGRWKRGLCTVWSKSRRKKKRYHGFWLFAHGTVRFRWHFYGAVRCFFRMF